MSMTENFECTPACAYCGANRWNSELHANICDVKGAIFDYRQRGRTFTPNTNCPLGYERGGPNNLSQQVQPGDRGTPSARQILDFLNRRGQS